MKLVLLFLVFLALGSAIIVLNFLCSHDRARRLRPRRWDFRPVFSLVKFGKLLSDDRNIQLALSKRRAGIVLRPYVTTERETCSIHMLWALCFRPVSKKLQDLFRRWNGTREQ